MNLRLNELARRCLRTGPEDKVYQSVKLAMVINALAAEGISVEDALAGVGISRNATSSPATRVSLHQIIECYRNANKLTHDPHFAYNAGLRFHFTDYGLYGFAMLSSTNYRRTMQFAMQYHQLATPLAEIDLKEASGCGIWTITPMAHPHIDACLYRFLLEMQFGITVSLHRDFMGPSFAAQELHVTYGAPDDAPKYSEMFGCPVLFSQSENQLRFDAAWLDRTPKSWKRNNLFDGGRAMRSPDGGSSASPWAGWQSSTTPSDQYAATVKFQRRCKQSKHERSHASKKAARRKNVLPHLGR